MSPSKKQVTGVALASIAAVATAAGAQAAKPGAGTRLDRAYAGQFDGDPGSRIEVFIKGSADSGSVFVKIAGVRIRCGATKDRESFADSGGYTAGHGFNFGTDNGTTSIRIRGSFAGPHAHGSIKVDTPGCSAPQRYWDAHT